LTGGENRCDFGNGNIQNARMLNSVLEKSATVGDALNEVSGQHKHVEIRLNLLFGLSCSVTDNYKN
jgi:hypothetical protein